MLEINNLDVIEFENSTIVNTLFITTNKKIIVEASYEINSMKLNTTSELENEIFAKIKCNPSIKKQLYYL